jgi:type II secretory ATPase GspE/PulE/Tfp pilus assembly ATPase PilB-like protein
VLRRLAGEVPTVEGLGLPPILSQMAEERNGLLLATGATGGGKSTTLAAMLNIINEKRAVHVVTLEDPVEFVFRMQMATFNQRELGTDFDTFATGLRAALRQAPKVILVGEMRDRETAELGVRAALVGRLLLSTLHTNDATAAVPRLMDMGIESFLLASTLSLVVGQRLVRRICTSCRESVTPEESVLLALQARPDFEETIHVLQSQGVLGKGGEPLAGLRLFRGKGCRQCSGSGFRGRLGLFELFEVDAEARSMIVARREGQAIRNAAIQRGMKTMFQDGIGKAVLGETTLEEVFRVAL